MPSRLFALFQIHELKSRSGLSMSQNSAARFLIQSHAAPANDEIASHAGLSRLSEIQVKVSATTEAPAFRTAHVWLFIHDWKSRTALTTIRIAPHGSEATLATALPSI